MKYATMFFAFFGFMHAFTVPAGAGVPGKIVKEVIEEAGKRFGWKAASRSGREVLEKKLVKKFAQHGDDALNAVRHGGLEAIEQMGKHGDDYMKAFRRYPNAARVLALHADDLLPVVRRGAGEVLEMEAARPGLGLKALKLYGDDGAKALAKADPNHLPRLLGYAEKAQDEAAQKALLEHYLKSRNPSAFLNAFNWKTIMVAGLTTSMVIAAYQVSDGYQQASIQEAQGVREGLVKIAKEDPETFMETVEKMHRPWYSRLLGEFSWLFMLALGVLLASLVAPVVVWSWKKCRKISKEAMPSSRDATGETRIRPMEEKKVAAVENGGLQGGSFPETAESGDAPAQDSCPVNEHVWNAARES